MSWIKIIPPESAEGRLKDLYRRVAGSSGQVDQILQAHSLRPHSLQGHMALYKAVLHHTGNKVPKQTLELIGVWVSWLNGCDYCVDHHFAGLCKLIGDNNTGERMKEALLTRKWKGEFSDSVIAMLKYAEALTLEPQKMPRAAAEKLFQAGVSDGEVLEVNQVVAYFNYANRTVLGLGVSTAGEVLGTSPNNSDDEDDWGHQPADAGNSNRGIPHSAAGNPAGKEHAKAGCHGMRSSSTYKAALRPTIHVVHEKAFQAGRNIQTGSPMFDAFFRISAGMAIGCSIGMVLYFGPTVEVKIDGFFPNHPLSTGAAFGFLASIPLNILYFLYRSLTVAGARRRRQDVPPMPKYIGRPALVVTALLTPLMLWVIDSTMF